MKAMTLRLPDDLYEEIRLEAFERSIPITTLVIAALRQRPPKGGGCDVCGRPHVMVSTPGGIRFCEAHSDARQRSEKLAASHAALSSACLRRRLASLSSRAEEPRSTEAN